MDENLRVDGSDGFYKKTVQIDNILKSFFYLNIILSFLMLFKYLDTLCVQIHNILIIFSITLNLLYILLSSFNEIFLKNIADNERRKLLINNSYNIKLSRGKTNKIYNNREVPSIRRFIINNFESVFFTKNIFDKMIFIEIIKATIIFCLYIAVIILLSNNDKLNTVLLITQTLFSAEIIISFIKKINYKITLDKIYNNFYNFLCVDDWNDKNTPVLLDASIDYQCLLSYSKISLSTKTFKENNDKLSKEWNEIEEDTYENLKNN